MKNLLLITLCFINFSGFCQTDQVLRTVFGDQSNFAIMNLMEHKQPEKIFILNKTRTWDYEIFWPELLGDETVEQLQNLAGDKTEGYDPEYLFRDPKIKKLINARERKSLKRRTTWIKSKKIILSGKSYSTVSSPERLSGFYVSTTEPVLTTDGKYAFVKIDVFFKEGIEEDTDPWSPYFAVIDLIYEKQKDLSWKRIQRIGRLIL